MRRNTFWLVASIWVLVLVSTACTVRGLENDSLGQPPVETAATEPDDRLAPDAESETPVAPAKTPVSEHDGEAKAVRATPERRPSPARVPALEKVRITGEVPEESLSLIIDDLLERADAKRESVEVQHAEAVVWADGSLGCPQPGKMYTQALVEGYWVVLVAGGKTYDFRANVDGYFFLCEADLSIPVSPLDGGAGEAPNQ